MNKRYTSYKQIDRDLRMLKLKKDIDRVCLESNVTGFKAAFSVPSLVKESVEVLGLSLFAARGNFMKVIAGYLLKKVLSR